MSRASSLVDGQWLEDHLADPDVLVLEVDERPEMYRIGHVPGAHCIDWRVDLQDPVTRDIPDASAIERLWTRIGLTEGRTVVLYGDKSNWWACFGFWLFRLYGARELRLLDGGRQAWRSEGRPTSLDAPAEPPPGAIVRPRDGRRVLRAGWRDVARGVMDGVQLLDVRTPAEFRGDVRTEPGYPEEAAQRAGHIPGAVNFPWDRAVEVDGHVLPDEILHELLGELGVTSDASVITYCRIGERSAHTWFVLHELLGIPTRNYDGSWTEWGSMMGMPVAVGDEPGAPRPLPRSLTGPE